MDIDLVLKDGQWRKTLTLSLGFNLGQPKVSQGKGSQSAEGGQWTLKTPGWEQLVAKSKKGVFFVKCAGRLVDKACKGTQQGIMCMNDPADDPAAAIGAGGFTAFYLLNAPLSEGARAGHVSGDLVIRRPRNPNMQDTEHHWHLAGSPDRCHICGPLLFDRQ